jgi:Sulfotransferase family
MAHSDVLIDRARRQAGLSDFGPDGWQEGLERLSSALHSDIEDSQSIATIEDLIVGRLLRRLRIQEWSKAHPAEMNQPVEGPLVILGLPRTGTTALHYLLALDPQFRYARKWELEDPIPPPETATEGQDRRRPGGPRRPSGPPRLDVQHVSAADGPTEDRRIHELAFNDSEGVLPVPSFTRWWRSSDHSPAMAFHERVLLLLHSRRPPRRWLLKDPLYLFQLKEFSAQYPAARFIVTHRDPVSVLPSTCSVIESSRRLRLPEWNSDPLELGREALDFLPDAVRQAAAARTSIGEDRFLDVAQDDLARNAAGTAHRIYEFAGLKLSQDTGTAMAKWARDNQPGSRGEHRYRAEDYGLTPDAIRSAFAGYLDQFGRFCV